MKRRYVATKDTRQPLTDEAFDINRGGAVVFAGITVMGAGLAGLTAYEAYSLWQGKVPPITWMVRASANGHPVVWAAATLLFGLTTGLLAGHFFWGGCDQREGQMMR